jgi:hypothetical protein
MFPDLVLNGGLEVAEASMSDPGCRWVAVIDEGQCPQR